MTTLRRRNSAIRGPIPRGSRPSAAAALLGIVLACSSHAGHAQGERDETDQVAAAATYLQDLVDGLRVTLKDGTEPTAHQVQPAPLLKYSDPARGYLAAGVWRLGKAGRPKGFISAEYWAPNTDNPLDQPFVSCEFIPLAAEPFEVIGARDELKWKADGNGPRWTAVSKAPPPAANARQRLTQMRGIARRLAAKESYRGNPNALRLMTHPVDRYQDPERGITDGAAFLFAYGTNPEVLILLECDDRRWQLAVLRMSWAETLVELDGRELVRFPELKVHPTSGPYRTAGYPLPERSPDRTGF